jgi:cbb3-type cytochrome oxidase subunit 1
MEYLMNTVPSRNATLWIKLAMLYLLVGITLGITMGASQNFTLRPVHAHINLIGWTTMALAGLIYTVFPQAGNSRLASVHFWLFNLALPVMMAALAMILTGDMAALPFLIVSEFVLAAGVLTFAANIFVNVGQRPGIMRDGDTLLKHRLG